MVCFAPRLRVLALSLALVLVGAGCTDGGGDGSATGRAAPGADEEASAVGDGVDASGESVPLAALASTAFVTAAIDDDDAVSQLAAEPFDDPDRGAPFERSVLAARFVELEVYRGRAAVVRPSTSAYADSADGLGPACDGSDGLRCQVDLLDGDGRVLASVVVYWLDDGITDFSIVIRAANGDPAGIGQAVCGDGSQLLHGGHTPDRFDIAVCVDQTGALEYNGAVRGDDLSIRLPACQQEANRWTATNEGFRYVVDGSISTTRSQIDIFDPDGDLVQSDPFTVVALEPPATPTSC